MVGAQLVPGALGTYLQISLLKAQPLADPIDMGSTILDESSGFKLAGCSQLKKAQSAKFVMAITPSAWLHAFWL